MTERLAIEREGCRVILTLCLADHYAAIEIYEKLIEQAREGFVLLDVETEAPPAGQRSPSGDSGGDSNPPPVE
jgi:hypothetical protein